MTEQKSIQPALTKEQWAHTRFKYNPELAPVVTGLTLWSGHSYDAIGLPDTDFTGAIALLNDALPDDDPRKITRADVALVRERAHDYRSTMGDVDRMDVPESEWTENRLDRIADKLAALLPPEEDV